MWIKDKLYNWLNLVNGWPPYNWELNVMTRFAFKKFYELNFWIMKFFESKNEFLLFSKSCVENMLFIQDAQNHFFNYSVRDDPFPYNSTLSNSIVWNFFRLAWFKKKWPSFGVGGVRDGLSSLKNLKSWPNRLIHDQNAIMLLN